MPPELLVSFSFLLAATTTWLMTPTVIRVATATGFLDQPAGYKGHSRPTPYLGGAAIGAGIVAAGLAFGDATGRFGVLTTCALLLAAVGTLDDRVNLSPFLRLAVEVAVAAVLAATGNGWEILGNTAGDAVLTIVWVVGVVNAVNLMDNMDGAAASVVGASTAGIAALALLSGDVHAAALCLGVSGACIGFLPRNLARPARVFMGDGGSMPLGLLVAGLAMAVVPTGGLGAAAVVQAAMLAGLVILDTSLVVVSRRRAGRPLLTGGRDHLSHRLLGRLGSPRLVATSLGATQLGLALLAVSTAEVGASAVITGGVVVIAAGAWAIWSLERLSPPVAVPVTAVLPVPAELEITVVAPAQAPTAPDPFDVPVAARRKRFARSSRTTERPAAPPARA